MVIQRRGTANDSAVPSKKEKEVVDAANNEDSEKREAAAGGVEKNDRERGMADGSQGPRISVVTSIVLLVTSLISLLFLKHAPEPYMV